MELPDFSVIDAVEGETMVVFENMDVANAYVMHMALNSPVRGGLIMRVEDTREGTGLVVQWRDPVRPEDMARKEAEARWLLEEILAGHVPRPEHGVVKDITMHMRQAAKPN